MYNREECPVQALARNREIRTNQEKKKKENEPERIDEGEGIFQREKIDIQERGEVVIKAVRQNTRGKEECLKNRRRIR
ncbi:hypothetical protein ARMGADRAFT_750929 [Armillaria gallica]|uniref:Uncharacterized protein n=1 Tax=Armillaria gallica TaxID=47427 RepID=A0A2H3E3F5_ARMGA|nr:hypothetical protein ARMGADRAFT_750929 [Armillaria gallica]